MPPIEHRLDRICDVLANIARLTVHAEWPGLRPCCGRRLAGDGRPTWPRYEAQADCSTDAMHAVWGAWVPLACDDAHKRIMCRSVGTRAVIVFDRDIFAEAQLLIDKHGVRAVLEAEVWAEQRRALGDTEAAAIWRRIRKAIKELQAVEAEGRTKH